MTFSDKDTKLKAERNKGGRPRVKSDTSAIAVDIAVQSASKGLKSIVFFHNQSSVPSSVTKVENEAGARLEYNENEKNLLDALIIELGGVEHVFVPNGMAGGHHGQLLPFERDLVESAFGRSGGIRILFSTNTLAQGMNLPADQVIIVRTSSYDPDTEAYRAIDASNLLNAAGRAGRAGHAASGLVLVIPNDIVTFDDASGQVRGSAIGALKNDVLGQDDRCLKICDPIEALLDQCALSDLADSSLLDSLVLRLPGGSEEEDTPDAIRHFFLRSLAAYKAKASQESETFEAKVNLIIARHRHLISEDVPATVATVCAGTGLLPSAVNSLLQRLAGLESPEQLSPIDWIVWLSQWLDSEPDAVSVIRNNMFVLDEKTVDCFRLWITGSPFRDMEMHLGTEQAKLGKLKKARFFARGIVREVSYLVGIIAQVASASSLEQKEVIERVTTLAAALIRDGVDSVDKLVLLQYMREFLWTRVSVHRNADAWLSLVEPPTESESPGEAKRRILRGINQYRSEQS